jgi:hypothetical protein
MDITLRTDIAGYFSYKIYRENPDNIIYESPIQKNLIVDSGLKHLYSLSVPEVMRVLDLGNLATPVAPEDLGIKGTTFANSNIFNDLVALNITGGFVSEDSTSIYTAFFRTKTTSSPTVLAEFAIKPGPKTDAFARQIFAPITLQPGDGIEFTYNVEVKQPCASYDTALKLFYAKKVLGEVESFQNEQLPLIWTSVSSAIDKHWASIESNNTTVVAVGSARPSTSPAISNIVYSTDSGMNWLSASAPEGATYLIDKPLNDVAFGTILDSTGVPVEKYVAVGLSALYTSDTGTVWLSGAPAANLNWTGISFGKPSNNPLFVAVSNTGANRVMKSSDTINWFVVNSNITNSINWSAITYGGNYYVAVADSGPYRVAYSTDGTTWNAADAPALNQWCDIAYNPEKDLFVAVSRNATYSPIMYASGGDITKWYPARSPYPASWNGVTHGNGVFVAVGESENQPRAIYSSNGIDWFPSTSISFDNVWKAVTFSNNTFVAVGSSLGAVEYPFARVDVVPRAGASFDVDARVALLSVKDKIYNQESYMYTLRGFDMPETCSVSPATAEELLYSTTLPYNSYVKATSNLISPNTAVSVYKFNSATGHGSIKNLLITDTILLTGYPTPGLWAIELNVAPQLTEPIVYTGDLNNIVSLSPEAGAITRSISSTIGDITKSELQFNVYHTWGPNRPEIKISTPSIAGDTRPYVDVTIPTWTVIDVNKLQSGAYYSDYVSYNPGIFPNFFKESSAMGCGGYGGEGIDPTTVTVINGLSLEYKSNIIIPGISSDTIARANFLPWGGNEGAADAGSSPANIINSINADTVNPQLSAFEIDSFNNSGVFKDDLINDLIDNLNNRLIIDDVTLSQIDGKAVIRIIFNKNSVIIPDYVNVITHTIIMVDDLCVNSEGVRGPGAQASTITNSYNVIRPT